MLEMLKERKATLEAQGKKGFTLMEMLIVIAIIAILIAIAIPLFTSQLDSAKHATNESNARSAYSIAMADYMDNNIYDNAYNIDSGTITIQEKGSTTVQTFKFENVSGAISFKQNDTNSTALPTSTGSTDKAKGAPVITLTDNVGEISFPVNS